MRRILYIPLLLAFLRALAPAATYYVSSSTGSDSNSGTSSSAAWQTIAHVNAQTFQPGDSILFKRGDVWNESLVPPSSGNSSSSIAFDAYGTGAPPNLTGYYPVPSSSWIFVSGNAWKAPLPSTYTTVNFCLFGSIWGQKVSAVSTNLTAQWDFYFADGYVYVYSQGNPATYYDEPIVPMALSNIPVININNQTWLTFQHFLIDWFDQYGVYVQGTSDHLVFANMEADSMIPQGTQPLGFYVNESTPGPGNIKIYNSEEMFGNKPGPEKKDAAMSFLENALGMADAIEQRDIVDPEKFRQGISEVIDGIVTCLNASAWAKPTPAPVPKSQATA
jgi:hypothetical protein